MPSHRDCDVLRIAARRRRSQNQTQGIDRTAVRPNCEERREIADCQSPVYNTKSVCPTPPQAGGWPRKSQSHFRGALKNTDEWPRSWEATTSMLPALLHVPSLRSTTPQPHKERHHYRSDALSFDLFRREIAHAGLSPASRYLTDMRNNFGQPYRDDNACLEACS
jgi:hypothetical protein